MRVSSAKGIVKSSFFDDLVTLINRDDLEPPCQFCLVLEGRHFFQCQRKDLLSCVVCAVFRTENSGAEHVNPTTMLLNNPRKSDLIVLQHQGDKVLISPGS